MTRRRTTAAGLTLALAGAALLGPAVPAAAGCAGDPARVLADTPVLFVAEAREVRERHATLAVREVWRGPELAPEVGVRTGPLEAPGWPEELWSDTRTSVDAHLRAGRTYLVGTTRGFTTNSCVVTEYPAGAEVAALRPDRVRQPGADGRAGVEAPTEPWLPALGAGAALALALGGGLLLWRRRRRG